MPKTLSSRCGSAFSGHTLKKNLSEDEYEDLKVGWLEFGTKEDAKDAEYALIGLLRPKLSRQPDFKPICPPQPLEYWKQKLLLD